MPFSSNFVWGAATSSYQIEGAALEDGRGECIWTRFSHTPGKVASNETGDVACDHYHRYTDDVALMQRLGLQAYRFSISWPRVLPQGTGATNQAGLDFYDRLVDALLAANITPFATLYHWDLPQALQDRGGWENPDSVAWFADYAGLMAARLGDRVQHWITHNEPWVVAHVGNWFGVHAPGKTDFAAALRVGHHVLRSHGAAVPVLRGAVTGAQVGITLNLTPAYPASDAPLNVSAAARYDGFFNRWFLDPVFRARYPADMLDRWQPWLAGLDTDAVDLASEPIDFLGVNYYTRALVQNDPAHAELGAKTVLDTQAEHTAMGWAVYPQGLTDLLTRVTTDYDPAKIYITENGSAYPGDLVADGIVDDPQRRDYLLRHIEAVRAAADAGVPMAGYFAWSLMDNFEWAEGYDKRFGLVHVDFDTLARTVKASGQAYADLIARETQA